MHATSHKLVTLSAIVMLLLAAAWALHAALRSSLKPKSAGREPAWTSYTDPLVGFTLEYPSDWAIVGPEVESYPDKIWRVVYSPQTEEHRAIVVRVRAVDSVLSTPTQWAEGVLLGDHEQVDLDQHDWVGNQDSMILASPQTVQFEDVGGSVSTFVLQGQNLYWIALEQGSLHDPGPTSEEVRMHDRTAYSRILRTFTAGDRPLVITSPESSPTQTGVEPP